MLGFLIYLKVETKIPKSSHYKINDYLHLVRLYGSYKQMGKQYGTLMRTTIHRDLEIFMQFIKNNEKIY